MARPARSFLQIPLEFQELVAIDDYRRRHPKIPSRAQAGRELLLQALGAIRAAEPVQETRG